MNPPWLEFPTYDPGCMGWRMGPGEDYLIRFQKWWIGLSPDQKQAFTAKHPTPKGWFLIEEQAVYYGREKCA
jgi:hypothetical protein